jgi:hypothetical protein
MRLVRSGKRRQIRERAHAASDSRHVPEPGQRLEPGEVSSAIREAIDKLPREEREAVSLRYEQGLPFRKAAEVLNVSEPTLNRRIHRGLRLMRSELTAKGFAVAAPLQLAALVSDLGVSPLPEALRSKLSGLLRDGPPPGHVPGPASGHASKRPPAPAGALVPWTLLAGAVALALPVAMALWDPDTENGERRVAPPLKEGRSTVRPQLTSAPSSKKEQKTLLLRWREVVHEDAFNTGRLDDFWTRRMPAAKPGYLAFDVGRGGTGLDLFVGDSKTTVRKGQKEFHLHERVEIVSRPLRLGEDDLSFAHIHLVRERLRCRGAWRFGAEVLAEDGGVVARLELESGREDWVWRIGDRGFSFGDRVRARNTVVVTPRGEVCLCERIGLANGQPSELRVRLAARERLRPKFETVRLRLFAEVPGGGARAEGEGELLARWRRVTIWRANLGAAETSSRGDSKN